MQMLNGRAGKLATLMIAVVMCAPVGSAQVRGSSSTIPVLMVSDIHFEPFWDPGKAQKLAGAPVPQWESILAAPDSTDRAQQFAALQQRCKTRGEDTSFPLFESSLRAMKVDVAGAKFVTLSGDLISHSFSCKFNATVTNAKAADYQEFVEKTIGFVQWELHKSFPRTPVYAALGNNDSNCEDYELDDHGPFLAEVGSLMTADVPKAEQKEAISSFTAEGDYIAPLPMHDTKLVVIDDLFQSASYKACGGKANQAAVDAQIAWLRGELQAAREKHEKVWVMGHIPPGINPYTTIRSMKNICDGAQPSLFLSSDALGATLAEFGDVVKLAIFGHTHMDEMRLLEPAKAEQGKEARQPVALKMVPSISPVDGNTPSFVGAQVDAETAVMKDYRVFASSNTTGVDAKWAEEYDYAKAYGEPDFSAKSLSKLVADFHADPQAQSAASNEYLKDYFVRDASLALKLFWPQYVCAVDNRTTESYRACQCGGGK